MNSYLKKDFRNNISEDIVLEIKKIVLDNEIIKREGDKFIFDYDSFILNNLELERYFQDNPLNFIKTLKEIIVEKFGDYPIFYKNLPQKDNISDIRVKHLGELVKITGMLSNVSMITAKTVNTHYECTCGTIIKVYGTGKPKNCSCGNSKGFRLIKKDMEDSQDLIIEECIEDIGDRNPDKVRVRLVNELCDKDFNGIVRDGNKLEIFGIVDAIPMKIDTKVNEELSYFRINAIQINGLEEDYDNLITDEDIKEIEKIAQNNPLQKLAQSLNPRIIGRLEEKKAIILSAIGAYPKNTKKIKDRGKINLLLIGDASCVDKDTEFFSQNGWKNISKYKKGDRVLQYNSNGNTELVYPSRYIKTPTKYLNLIKTKYVNQCVSDNHRIIYLNKGNKIKELTTTEVIKKHKKNVLGFRGKFITSFNYEGKGINLTDEQIRVQVAFMAEGTIVKTCKKRGIIHIKKDRKKVRLKRILKAAGIKFIERKRNNGYSNIRFTPPLLEKTYSNFWYNCSSKQMKIIGEECLFWDGDQKNRFFTTIKSDADFIQFVWSSIGYRSIISPYERVREYKGISRNCIEYSVYKSKTIKVGMTKRRQGDTERIVSKYKTKDGYSYCFNVPSGMLVFRRNNRIVVTGNCGKTQLLQALNKKYFGSIYTGCERMTDASLIGGAEKDELTGVWQLKSGIIPRANKSILILDEFDKMDKKIQKNLHTPMESGIAPINIIGRNVLLNADTTFICGANPKNSRFDPMKALPPQINMSDTLISRFTLILAMRDYIKEDKDRLEIRSIWDEGDDDGDETEEYIDDSLFRKYFKYAQKFNPKNTEISKKMIEDFYINVRKKTKKSKELGIAIPIVMRQAIGLDRLAQASARCRLSNTVDKQDAQIAIDLYSFSLKQLGMYLEDGFDFAKIGIGVTLNSRERKQQILEFIKDKTIEKGFVLDEEIEEYSEKINLDKLELNKFIYNIKQEGLIFSPRNGQYKYLG